VDCGADSRILSYHLAAHSKRRQDRDYAQRVLSHELYHVLAHTTGHTASGLTKARVGTGELTAEHFGFGKDAIDRPGQLNAPDPARALARVGL